jgi:diguanylate cyclase (GGDEF)-like protein
MPQVTPNRALKSISRSMLVSWREQPSQYDIEEVEDNIRRVGLVIRVRWALVAVLALFSLAALFLYARDTSVRGFERDLAVPAIALLFVLVYNAFFQATYRRFGNFAWFNNGALLLDSLVAGVLVYYSGGVYSWFYVMWVLFVIEAALILARRWYVWGQAAFSALLYGAIVWLEYFDVLPGVEVPFAIGDLAHAGTYVAVRFLWTVTILFGAATISLLIVDQYRRRERVLRADSLLDHETGLYNRPHFFRVGGRDLERATRHGRAMSVIVIDVDDFDRFNQALGYEAADAVLGEIAGEMREAMNELGAADDADLAVAFRFAGDEFAVVMPHEESALQARSAAHPKAVRLAERIRNRVRLVRRGDLHASVSVGVATYPDDGAAIEDLVDVADRAIALAHDSGGDRVVTSEGLASVRQAAPVDSDEEEAGR